MPELQCRSCKPVTNLIAVRPLPDTGSSTALLRARTLLHTGATRCSV